jgi:acetyl esterase/lipase
MVRPPEILSRPARPPDHVLHYGPREDQIADLRLPVPVGRAAGELGGTSEAGEVEAGSGVGVGGAGRLGLPLVIFLHGGFWRARYDRTHTGPLAEALAAAGFAVCTPEFRRTGQAGGGWPGTFDDVAAAVDALPGLVAEVAGAGSDVVDVGRVVLGGHSAGGHLALWAAGRSRLPVGERWHSLDSGVIGVVGLAGVCDLAGCFRQGLGGNAAGDLMGGGPDEVGERYAVADPMGLVPTGTAVRLVHGTRDRIVPVQLSKDYAAQAEAAGDDVRCDLVRGGGHFGVIDPLSRAWPMVLEAFRSAAEGSGGDRG